MNVTLQLESKLHEAGETSHSSSNSFESVKAWLEHSDTRTNSLKRKRSLTLDTPIPTSPPTPLTPNKLDEWTEIMNGHEEDFGLVYPDLATFTISLTFSQCYGSLDGSDDPPTDETNITKPPIIKIAKDSNSVKIAMEAHGILQNKAVDLDRYPEFKQKMKDILSQNRSSAMKKREVQEFQKTLAQVERLNEDTILQNLVPLIIRRKYTSDEDLEGQELESYIAKFVEPETGEERMALRKDLLLTQSLWSDDGLLVTMKSEFFRTFLPNQFEELGFEAALASALAKQHGMKNPRPDYCYGLTPDTFVIPRGVMLAQDIRELLQVANGVYHAFLLIEGKADRGELAHAQNQAARGGATLVKASRTLLEKLGEPDVRGVDDRTMIFSVAMNQTVLEIWLHWADVVTAGETKETIVNYHSNRLATRALGEDDQLMDTRRMLHNILNWGCNTRKADLLKLHERLHAHQERETQKQLQEEKARKQDPSNKKRKKGDGAAGSSSSRA